MLLLSTVSVENLTGYDDIVCEFSLCTFNLRDQPAKFTLTFQLLIFKWSNFEPCRLLLRHCQKHFRETQKNTYILLFSYNIF